MKTIRAIYRNWVIKPQEKVDLVDGAEINITIDSRKPMSQEERDDHDRRQNCDPEI